MSLELAVHVSDSHLSGYDFSFGSERILEAPNLFKLRFSLASKAVVSQTYLDARFSFGTALCKPLLESMRYRLNLLK